MKRSQVFRGVVFYPVSRIQYLVSMPCFYPVSRTQDLASSIKTEWEGCCEGKERPGEPTTLPKKTNKGYIFIGSDIYDEALCLFLWLMVVRFPRPIWFYRQGRASAEVELLLGDAKYLFDGGNPFQHLSGAVLPNGGHTLFDGLPLQVVRIRTAQYEALEIVV